METTLTSAGWQPGDRQPRRTENEHGPEPAGEDWLVRREVVLPMVAGDLGDELEPPAARRTGGGLIRHLRAFGRPSPAPEDRHEGGSESEGELESFQPFGTRDSLQSDSDRHEDRFGDDEDRGGDRDGNGPGGLRQWAGRRRTPVLAAAALTVALCVAVPVLLAQGGGDSDHVTAESAGGNAPVSDPLGDLPPVLPESGGEPSASGDGRGEDGQAGKSDDSAVGDDGSLGEERPAGDGADPGPAAGDEGSDTGGRPASDPDGQPTAEAPAPRMTPVATGQWETASHTLAASATGKCLARQDARAVGQDSCGPHRWSRRGTGVGTYLLKHVGANRCLDTDGSKLYLSDCTPEDSGQVWRLTAADGCGVTILSVPFGTRVTAAGYTRATTSSSGTVWRAPSLFNGC
ncbi:hypothetical protein [Streptomyces sp. YS415]|uniref:RICIN domain-containing protein n=1 Tax=Streptomyces sp. YS415 TaxID=2944806 RepID=UPI0020215154|nr:hypothetical protein [Streptomyces sp. YS415]MCL7430161.1 hypothetical protein [Streptomyces sp. YS415]